MINLAVRVSDTCGTSTSVLAVSCLSICLDCCGPSFQCLPEYLPPPLSPSRDHRHARTANHACSELLRPLHSSDNHFPDASSLRGCKVLEKIIEILFQTRPTTSLPTLDLERAKPLNDHGHSNQQKALKNRRRMRKLSSKQPLKTDKLQRKRTHHIRFL